MTLIYTNANQALPALLHRVLAKGTTVESRNGTTLELLMQQITLENPVSQKEITAPGRKVSLPAQIAETMWILAGRNDVDWLSHYLPRAKDFADDGMHWRGGYGPRLRKWGESLESWQEYDQLAYIVDLLKLDPETRRAVFTIYNPAVDNEPGKDIPCNNWVHFIPRNGVLHGHVAIRSNDLFWGWSGINAFEWTSLLQVVSGLTGMKAGSLTFSISSLHLYERHWAKAEEIIKLNGAYTSERYQQSPTFEFDGSLAEFDTLVARWFEIEAQIRKGGISSALLHQISTFREPMLRSWLFVLLAWHHDDIQFMEKQYRGTALAAATAASPKRKRPELTVGIDKTKVAPESSVQARFTTFASQLHFDKNAVYGDSWKKRGEMLGIMANIARKVDRLGVAGGGDSSADTAIDMLMYLIKYQLWLRELAGDTTAATSGDAHVQLVNKHLQLLEETPVGVTADADIIDQIHARFLTLEHWVEEKRIDRIVLVNTLVHDVYPLAVRLWAKEQWHSGNEARAFNGYAEIL